MVRHLMVKGAKGFLMHVLLWNVGEMHVSEEMSGRGIRGQGTRGKCIEGQGV
jgi:hypothetical protein